MKLRRDFAEEGQLSLVEAIEEVPVTAIALVKRPGFHGNSVVDGLVDQLQSDLALGEKFDVLGDMRFFFGVWDHQPILWTSTFVPQ